MSMKIHAAHILTARGKKISQDNFKIFKTKFQIISSE